MSQKSSDLCHVVKSEVVCEVKEASLGFDDVMTDEPLLYFFSVLSVSIYSRLLILHGEQPALFSQFVK